jgi:uncharacterized membrane protein YfcA
VDILTVVFPVSGVETNVLIPPLTAFFIGMLSATGGLSGAFLLLPFQMSILGFTTPAVSSTNLFYNVVSIPSGIWRYFRDGRMLWPLVAIMVAGTVPGTVAGYWVRVTRLPDPRAFKLFVGVVLAFICTRLFLQALRAEAGRGGKRAAMEITPVRTVTFSLARVEYTFGGETYSFPVPVMFVLSVAVGVIGGIYGIGGGAILAPFWVAVFHLPVYTVAGASLLGTFITSVAGVGFYTFLPSPGGVPTSPDWALGALFGVGGLAGIWCGASLQRHLPPRLIKLILGVLISIVAVRYITGFFT